jgi:hypothetical protein
VRCSGVQATSQYVKLECRHALKRLYQGSEIEKTRKQHAVARPSSPQLNTTALASPASSTTHSPNPSHHLASPTTPKQPKRAPNPSPTLPSDPQTAHPNPAAELTFPTQPAHLSASHHITSHKLNANGTKPLNFQQQPSPICTPSEPANSEPRQNLQRDRQTARHRTARSRLTKKRRKGKQKKRPRRS